MPDIGDLMEQLRDLVNLPRRQHALIAAVRPWHMICSCMDILEDAELAITAYLSAPFPASAGEKYLFVYGTLQALFGQQDALVNLHESLGIPYELTPTLRAIRDARNDAVGHPTRRRSGNRETYHFISRITMTRSGFQLVGLSTDHSASSFRSVDLVQMIERQRASIGDALQRLLDVLQAEEEAHRSMFRHENLADLFSSSLGYCFEKVKEATWAATDRAWGAVSFSEIEQALRTFKEKLSQRGLLGALVGVDSTLELLVYPMDELHCFFDDACDRQCTTKAAYIFADFVERQFEELKEMATEVDEDYRAGAESTT
jgi:hypothetical protein